MDNFSNHINNLAKSLLKIGKTRQVKSLSSLVNSAIDDDLGGQTWVDDIEKLTNDNENFRTTKWTGEYFQLTLMSLEPGEDIGLEVHHDVEQFIRVEKGSGILAVGADEDEIEETYDLHDDFAVIIPAGTWHNITNTGDGPLKIYSIYAKPEHPKGTVHKDKKDDKDHDH